MHINSIPDLVFRLIFSKVPLQDLLNAGRVCSLWKSYQVETCNQVRSLTLLIGPTAQSLITNSCFTLKYRDLLLNEDGRRMYSSQHLPKHFHLTCGSFKMKSALDLSNTFPLITTLEIAIPNLDGQIDLCFVVPLFGRWYSALKSLKIYLKFYNHNIFEQITPKEAIDLSNLLNLINSMQSLEHLTLDTNCSICSNISRFKIKLDFPILSQLHEFYFKSSDRNIDFIEKSLKSYGVQNANLKQIGLEFSATNLNLIDLFPQLIGRMVYIPPSSVGFSPKLSITLRQFSSLTSIYFLQPPSNDIIHNLLNQVMNNLLLLLNNHLFNGGLNLVAPLRKLTHLHYNCFFQYSQAFSREGLLQLSSVQVLILGSSVRKLNSIHDAYKYQFMNNNWSYLFPNVQVIEVNLHAPVDYKKLQQSLSTFVQCPKLHSIFTMEIKSEQEVNIRKWVVRQVGNRKLVTIYREKLPSRKIPLCLKRILS